MHFTQKRSKLLLQLYRTYPQHDMEWQCLFRTLLFISLSAFETSVVKIFFFVIWNWTELEIGKKNLQSREKCFVKKRGWVLKFCLSCWDMRLMFLDCGHNWGIDPRFSYSKIAQFISANNPKMTYKKKHFTTIFFLFLPLTINLFDARLHSS